MHLSDSSLPDWRIEKSAYSSKRRGDEVHFAGNNPFNHKSKFDKVYDVKWSSRARNKFPFYWNSVKKQISNIITEVKPDIIHAHNIFSATVVKEIDDYPLVYDNHEYWTMYTKTQIEKFGYSNSRKNDALKRLSQNLFRNQINNRFVKIWSKAEKELVEEKPTITVSNSIVTDLKKLGKNIYLVPNFPLFEEVNWIPKPEFHHHKSSVYAGIEPTGMAKSMHRNLEGFIDLFGNNDVGKLFILGWRSNVTTPNIQYLGLLNRIEMYKQMQNHSTGLIPFKKHWFHQYSSPNKAYEYAHAGLFVVSSNGFVPVFDTLQDNCLGFIDYTDLRSKLRYLLGDMEELYYKRVKIYEFARNNLLWENYENNIFEAYKQA